MFFDLDNLVWIIGISFFVWLVVLSLVFYRLLSHYRRLTGGVAKGDLRLVLEKLLKTAIEEKKRVDGLIKSFKGLEKEGLFHLQKVGLVRFNPFAETGGDQSFCLALLDANNSGLVISSLHSRETTRIYAKPIKKGKEAGYIFSDEEKKAIKEAKKMN